MEKEALLKDFEAKFKALKAELKFKSSLEELDSIFYVRDFILRQDFVSPALSRQLCSRLVDTFASWNSYLQGLITPQPYSLLNITESNFFSDEEKRELQKLINKSVSLLTANTLVGLTKDKMLESKFIDDCVDFWKKVFRPELIKIIKKIHDGWKRLSSEK